MSLNRRVLLVPLSVLCGFMLALIMEVTPFSKAAPAPAAQPQIGRYQLVGDKSGSLMLLETSTGKVWVTNVNRAGRDTEAFMEWKVYIDAPPAK
jgi:hypothetical protein